MQSRGCGALAVGLLTLQGFVVSPFADKNVYDEPLSLCGDSSDGLMCPYAPDMYDPGAHQVCVTELPDGFSYKTGQGDWSDSETGKPWCICIWAYSNYVLNHGDTNLPVNCAAIPDKVLVSEYSLDNFKQCGSMASACNQYDQAVEKMCAHCSSTAPNDKAKASVDAKCDALRDSLSEDQEKFALFRSVPTEAGSGAAVVGLSAIGLLLVAGVWSWKRQQRVVDSELAQDLHQVYEMATPRTRSARHILA